MPKREAEHQITKDSANAASDDEQEQPSNANSWVASAEEMAKRRIVKVKRREPVASSAEEDGKKENPFATIALKVQSQPGSSGMTAENPYANIKPISPGAISTIGTATGAKADAKTVTETETGTAQEIESNDSPGHSTSIPPVITATDPPTLVPSTGTGFAGFAKANPFMASTNSGGKAAGAGTGFLAGASNPLTKAAGPSAFASTSELTKVGAVGFLSGAPPVTLGTSSLLGFAPLTTSASTSNPKAVSLVTKDFQDEDNEDGIGGDYEAEIKTTEHAGDEPLFKVFSDDTRQCSF